MRGPQGQGLEFTENSQSDLLTACQLLSVSLGNPSYVTYSVATKLRHGNLTTVTRVLVLGLLPVPRARDPPLPPAGLSQEHHAMEARDACERSFGFVPFSLKRSPVAA